MLVRKRQEIQEVLRKLKPALGALVMVAASTAASAQSLSAPVNVSASANGSQLPSLVVDAFGTPRLFWHDFTSAPNLLWCSEHDGTAWSAGSPCAPNVTQSWSPRAAADRFGDVHLAWRDRTGGNDEILYARFDGTSWSAPVNVSRTAEASGNPTLAVDSLGNPHVAWEEGPAGAKRFFEAWFDGAAWTPARDTGLPFVQAAALDVLRIGFAPDDTLHAVWHDGATSLTEIWHAELPPGGAWGAAENVSSSPTEVSVEPALAFAPDGTLDVAWVEQDPVIATAFETCLSARSTAGTWGPRQDVSQQGSSCYRPAIAVGSDGVPRLAWHADTATGKEVFFVQRPGDTPANVSSSAADSSRVTLALDPSDAAWLAWTEGATTTAEIYASTTATLPRGPVLLRVSKNEAAGDVILTWTGAVAPWRVRRGDGPDPAGASWTELSAPAGAPTPDWTDAGVLRDGTNRFYLAD